MQTTKLYRIEVRPHPTLVERDGALVPLNEDEEIAQERTAGRAAMSSGPGGWG